MSYRKIARILQIEDIPADAAMLQEGLELVGLPSSFDIFEDGKEALRVINEYSGAERPPFDLIVLDLHMPGTDSDQILKALRGPGAFAEMPLLVLSGFASDATVEKLLALPHTHYAEKPNDLTALLTLGERIREILDADGAEQASSE